MHWVLGDCILLDAVQVIQVAQLCAAAMCMALCMLTCLSIIVALNFHDGIIQASL